jgi:hypothetical protein
LFWISEEVEKGRVTEAEGHWRPGFSDLLIPLSSRWSNSLDGLRRIFHTAEILQAAEFVSILSAGGNLQCP